MRNLGRRGGVLALFGLCWIVLGVGFAVIQTERFSRPGAGGPLEFMDSLPLPGLFWALCGMIALVNGVTRQLLDHEDAVGYASLIMPPTLWVLAYTWSFTMWVFTRDSAEPYGRMSGFLGAVLFLVIVVIIRVIANWPDPDDIPGESVVMGSEELETEIRRAKSGDVE